MTSSVWFDVMATRRTPRTQQAFFGEYQEEKIMKLRLTTLAILLALASALLIAPLSAAAAPSAAPPTAGVTTTVGTFLNSLGQPVDITATVQRFSVQGGELVARVLFTATNTVTGATQSVTQTVPVIGITATCDILHLELGPIDLDLLGLVVHVDQIVIDIDAQSGPGNLLGNLLCAVAGLLDGGLNLNGLARLLNQILSILG
jgi:hypothetical protein